MTTPVGRSGGARPIDDAAPREAAPEAASTGAPTAAVSRAPTAPESVGAKLTRSLAERGPGGAAGVQAAAPVAPAQGANAPAAVVERFLEAFVKRDYDAMDRLYASPKVTFHDSLFDYDDHASTMKMQRTLLEKAEGLRGTYRITSVDGDTVKAHWEPEYKFAGRPVHNVIDTTFKVKDGKIVSQSDDWDWKKWSSQALPLGKLGSSAPVRAAFTHLMRWFVK